MEAPEGKERRERWITRYDRTTERIFLFYGTVVMLVVWGCLKLFGG